ncbi:flavodoxin [Plasticicumulans acidivorans]|uniref:Multimeric flavodoxin WrbA n=1 Tax=Plasticicumulans acidivorans TaxID=886464 RepID=A0A317MV89_9GAMM|nr:flavodoxin [Plasticicumulans acidivorans]PWV61684.1 multimeric flavodoxin WrbA [Plasticicumulans acidivorans]
MRKRLLIVFHTRSGHTGRLIAAAYAGACSAGGVDVELRHAPDAGVDDLLGCDGLLLGTPENFGTLCGLVKDFLERCYYPCEGRTVGLPYALLISAGNDGRGAVREIGRIATGYGWREVAEALIVRGEFDATALVQAHELGEALAAGLELGVF